MNQNSFDFSTERTSSSAPNASSFQRYEGNTGNGQVAISYGNSLQYQPLHNTAAPPERMLPAAAGQGSQQHSSQVAPERPLSPGSFGSFSMGEEDNISVSSDAFRDEPLPNTLVLPQEHPRNNILPANGVGLMNAGGLQGNAARQPLPLGTSNPIQNGVLEGRNHGAMMQSSQQAQYGTSHSNGVPERIFSSSLQTNSYMTQQQQQRQQQQQQTIPARQQSLANYGLSTQQNKSQPKKANDKIIELIDDEEDEQKEPIVTSAGFKRSRPTDAKAYNPARTVVPGSTLSGYQAYQQTTRAPATGSQTAALEELQRRHQNSLGRRNGNQVSKAQYMPVPPNYSPTWQNPLPLPPLNYTSNQHPSQRNQRKYFELSLLNHSEFTITGLPVSFDGRRSSVLGFRKIIKEISRGLGKAVFERDNPNRKKGASESDDSDPLLTEGHSPSGEDVNPDGGKWRIPLGAYFPFLSYLRSDPMCRVEGIPMDQLKIASFGRQMMNRGDASLDQILSYGVPEGLANALAPFQRSGVDFVVERRGRALIADDMGLGKTIQSIAAMTIYADEWPLLILTPSSARYHWAAEFNNWLGAESSVNKGRDAPKIPNLKPMRLLKESEIHVMVAGREEVLPTEDTRVVICSYGLATSLVESGKIHKGLFKCAIVDESHMLKNIRTKRTKSLVPILHSTERCILLSGTPAFARPAELWPQLKILSIEGDFWCEDEEAFIRKYVQRASAVRRAELHTMLTGTVMIRRLKHKILKSLPAKQREKAVVDVLSPTDRRAFSDCMKMLREGKGVMAKFAKKHAEKIADNAAATKETEMGSTRALQVQALNAERNQKYRERLESIKVAISRVSMNDQSKKDLFISCSNDARVEIDDWYRGRLQELNGIEEPQELDRKSILNKMYSMTAKAKTPLIADMLKKWLANPTKGKLCIFAHHINVLDEISKLAGLSNLKGSTKRFIRIEGSTNPKERQSQIVAFQNDPGIRIALLGITAAGVAVTLTASSTVWFAELFWTPALMIQAEDRCHRIGQNATVKCLYFVASGTLDVLLWDLLEKKFQDLGEFVEGKEKMKIVVQKTYNTTKEVQSMFDRVVDDDPEDTLKTAENDTSVEGDDLIRLESDLQEDIGRLAQEEMIMISQGDDEDGTDGKVIASVQASQSHAARKSAPGETEDDAICLSDDEDDAELSKEVSNNDENTLAELRPEDMPYPSDMESRVVRVLKRKMIRFYKQSFKGSSYGIQLMFVDGRLAISNNIFGGEKPAVGDVLIGVNGGQLMLGCPLDQACLFMKEKLRGGTVELWFMEDDVFSYNNKQKILDRVTYPQPQANKKPRATQTKDVIEIE